MCKKTDKSTNGTSFQQITFRATVNQLIKAFGEPSMEDNTGEDKTNFEWDMETKDGFVFCIYDWKQYRVLDLDKAYDWHIGALGKMEAFVAQKEILKSF